jgi:hypothetical protein
VSDLEDGGLVDLDRIAPDVFPETHIAKMGKRNNSPDLVVDRNGRVVGRMKRVHGSYEFVAL